MGDRPEPFDPGTGEIIPPADRAADGRRLPAIADTAGNFLDLIEDGRFSADAYAAIKDLGGFLMHRSRVTEAKAKGDVTIKITMEADGDSFKMVPKVTIKKPEVPRPRSTMWQDDRGAFCRFPPNQRQFFGVSDSEDDERRAPRSI